MGAYQPKMAENRENADMPAGQGIFWGRQADSGDCGKSATDAGNM